VTVYSPWKLNIHYDLTLNFYTNHYI